MWNSPEESKNLSLNFYEFDLLWPITTTLLKITWGFQFNFTITNVNNFPDLTIHITLRVPLLTFTCVKIDIFITSTLISLNVNLNLTCKTVLLKISQLDQYPGKILQRKIVNFRMIWFSKCSFHDFTAVEFLQAPKILSKISFSHSIVNWFTRVLNFEAF